MNDSQRYIKNLIFGNDGSKVVQNTPEQYNSRQKQYLADRTSRYIAERSYLASDYVQADIQGLLPYFYDYTTLNIRLADILSPNANATKKVDDYKQVLIPDRAVDYLPIGAKINTMGSTWIVINPSNISSVSANAVIARCNATYNSYDYYGNIIVEPIVVEKYTMSNNDNDNSINLVLMDGYFNITCQLNENTKNLGINKRIILGDKPYHITGFTDFIQEFTGNRNNIHIMSFTARIDEPTESDDLTMGIAGGKEYVVGAELNGQTDLIAGQATILTADFLINGKKVESTTEHPLTWEYKSSNESIAKVSSDGRVNTYRQGTAKITAQLVQNPLVVASIDLLITEAVNAPYIAFDGLIHDYVSQYSKETFSATYFENNLATNYPLKWSFSGATKRDYIATVSEDGRSVTIECLSASEKPLKITATYNGVKASIKVNLVGY
nr:MAG TPA: head closure knob [Caudoviricetes sp.]